MEASKALVIILFSNYCMFIILLFFSTGQFQLFSKSTEIVDAKEMLYSMSLTSIEGKDYYFHGQKIIKDDKLFETGLEDTTTLFTKIYEGDNDQGHLLAEGILKMKVSDCYKQVKTIEIINTESSMEKLKWKTRFSNFFSKELWDTYSGISEDKKFDPDAPPRERRDLNIDILPELHKCITEDKVGVQCQRYHSISIKAIIEANIIFPSIYSF